MYAYASSFKCHARADERLCAHSGCDQRMMWFRSHSSSAAQRYSRATQRTSVCAPSAVKHAAFIAERLTVRLDLDHRNRLERHDDPSLEQDLGAREISNGITTITMEDGTIADEPLHRGRCRFCMTCRRHWRTSQTTGGAAASRPQRMQYGAELE